MFHRCLVVAAVALPLAAAVPALAAGSQGQYKAALTAANAAEQQAGALKTQWTTTEDELKAAKKAADAGDFDQATSLARHAEALAKASIAQAKEQAKVWKDADVR